MFRRVTTEEQVREERQQRLKGITEQKEAEEMLVEQMVEMDFRQSMLEMGV